MHSIAPDSETQHGKNKKLLFLVTEDWYFWSHRLALAREALAQGYRVVIATHVQNHGSVIEREGFRLIPLTMSRKSRNPLREILSIIELVRIYRAERPDVVHHVAMKPILYGTFAAYIARVPVIINALAGLGYLFTSRQITARVMRPMVLFFFRFLLNLPNAWTILQNRDDQSLLTDSKFLKPDRIVIIRGSGVDTKKFVPLKKTHGPPVIVFAARMLRDKGVHEFVGAARLLQARGIRARFVLIGDTDSHNPTAIPTSQLQDWHRSGVVEWWGYREDIATVYGTSHIACLPSYREGLPKSLLEAAACGLPIVTSDVPGCREVVLSGVNGLLVPPRDALALADALARLIADPDECGKMGSRGRELCVREFSLDKVVQETMALYRRALT